jgi:hypothetical protein
VGTSKARPMDYSLPADLWDKVIPISAAVGAVAGFIWDVGNSIRMSNSSPATGIDNIVTLPRSWKDEGSGRNIDLGLLGPVLVGALAGVLLVLLAGRSTPGAQEAASAINKVANNVNSQPGDTKQVAEQTLTTQITAASLFFFAALGGLSGWPLLRAMSTRTSKLVEAAVGVAYGPASREAKEAVQDVAQDMKLTAAQKRKLSDAAESAVKRAAPAALRVRK